MTRARAGVAALVAAVAGFLATTPSVAVGQSFRLGGEIGGSVRMFPEAPVLGDQSYSTLSPSVTLAPEGSFESADGRWWVAAEGFLRVDAHDANRSHVDVRELGLGYLGTSVTAFAGVGQVFWGVTEIRHLVDVVNQVDAVEGMDGEAKLGQPMLALTFEGGWGALDLYYLPWFRERTFPAADARLSGPLPVSGRASYAAGRGRWHPDVAARAFRTMGTLDVGVSAFRGISREPRFALEETAEGGPVLTPWYDLVDQLGVDAQWTGDRTLLKLEVITRGGHGSRLYALTGGVEHTRYQAFGSSADLGLLFEVMLDSRDERAPPTVFDHDVFAGARWAWNDVTDTSVLGGPIVDLRTGEVLILMEGGRRLGTAWRLELDVTLFPDTSPGSPAHGFRRDSHLALSLTRYF